MSEKVKGPLVLTIICTIVAIFLVVIYNLTYVDNTGVLTDTLLEGCNEIFPAGDYKLIMTTDENGEKAVQNFGNDSINNIIVDKNKGNIIVEVIASGYEKDSIDVLVGFDKDGIMQGVYVLSVKDTPGLGAKIKDESYLENYKGIKDTDALSDIDGITSATYSSNGLKDAITQAFDIYNNHKGEILNEQ